jgi:hypothetical protein
MGLLVSYLSEGRIEADADALLDEFVEASGSGLQAPVPIDDIVEKHLKLGIEFDDLHRRFGAPNSVLAQGPDIIGAIFLSQRRIVVDEFLDPDADPSKEGRYRFTVAHEVGHWRLHRGLMGKDIGNVPVEDSSQAMVICRSSEAKARVELQADIFASCLLMPRRLVQAAWIAAFADGRPRALKSSIRLGLAAVPIEDHRPDLDDAEASETSLLDRFVDPFAREFAVSAKAMRVRLERLGLVLRGGASPNVSGRRA